MEINLTGVWTGEMEGTNVGGMSLELQHSGDRIYGQGQFTSPHWVFTHMTYKAQLRMSKSRSF